MTTFPTAGKARRLIGSTADVAGRLRFAATPTFALMAWISGAGSPGMTTCSAATAFLPINDMSLMYLLMSVFHLSPWLTLFHNGSHRPITQTEGD